MVVMERVCWRVQVCSSEHCKLRSGPGGVAGVLIQRNICTPTLNVAFSHGGPPPLSLAGFFLQRFEK